ncbi:UBP-type zinc finger-containing protein, partial [Reticulomyxa filosa]
IHCNECKEYHISHWTDAIIECYTKNYVPMNSLQKRQLSGATLSKKQQDETLVRSDVFAMRKDKDKEMEKEMKDNEPLMNQLEMNNNNNNNDTNMNNHDYDEQLKKGWSQFSPVIDNGCLGIRGIINLGNTCYLSVLLQCFGINPYLRHYFLSEQHKHMHFECIKSQKLLESSPSSVKSLHSKDTHHKLQTHSLKKKESLKKEDLFKMSNLAEQIQTGLQTFSQTNEKVNK